MSEEKQERVSTTCHWIGKRCGLPTVPWFPPTTSTRSWDGAGRSSRRLASNMTTSARAPENNWYPHYIHNLDNLIRFGGLYPPIAVHADLRRTVLLGATWVHEGRLMAVRARIRSSG